MQNALVITYADTTAEVTAERARQEGQAELRSILEAAPDPVLAIDEAGTITQANEATEDVFGWPLNELIGRNVSTIAGGGTAKEHDAYLRHYIATGEASTPEGLVVGRKRDVTGRRKDGSEFPIELSVAEIPGTDPPRFVGVVRDLTERIAMRNQVIAAQKSEAVGTLVAGVAHDFNNLLLAIGGSLELASEDLESNLWLDRARLATDRASDLVRQLLQVSRRQPTQPSIVELGSLLTETISLVLETTDRRVIFNPTAPISISVWADRSQLQQVLMNLLVNARDAVLERLGTEAAAGLFQPRIDIALSRSGADGSWCDLVVADNGVGTSEEVRERIFDPFFTTKEVDQGTGLGMSIVFAIVTEHGGTVAVESAPGQGTTVRVQLPEAIAEVVPASEPDDASRLRQLNQQASILIVDDEPTICAFTEQLLTNAGYDVSAVQSGEDALIELAKRSYTLLLLDVNMPSPDGWQVLDEALKRDPNQCVLMLSGYALEEEALGRGAGGIVQKPFTGSALIEAVAAELA